MARFIKTNKENIGLSPDAIRFRGEKKSDFVKLSVIDYDANNLSEISVNNLDEIIPLTKSNTTTWLNIDGLHNEELMKYLSEVFSLDTLIISDILNTQLRPKIHEYNNCIFISLKILQFNEKSNKIFTENLVIIIKDKLLISFQEKESIIFVPIKERLRNNRKRLRGSGTDYLAFALIDVVIDNYLYLISRIGEKVENLDEYLIENPSISILEEIKKYKREINYLRKTIVPCRDMIVSLVKMDSELISENLLVHLKELQDNINLANESIESYREILSDQLNIFHTNVSNKLNDILKFLTIFSVIFIPLTFIAGIYGTNFDYIPELHFRYGYFAMWGIIIIIAVFMIFVFKRKKWL